jgi:RNA polymerase sigma factor (sigma-70 family)
MGRHSTPPVAGQGEHLPLAQADKRPDDVPRREVDPLLLRARGGDRQSLNEIVDRLIPLAWNVARVQGLDAEAASDVVQSTLVRVPQQLHDVRSGQELTTWVIKATRREARKQLAAQRRNHQTEPGVPAGSPDRFAGSPARIASPADRVDDSPVGIAGPADQAGDTPARITSPADRADDPPAGIAGREQYRSLWRSFTQLSPRCQEFLRIMAFVDQPDHRMVAEQFGGADRDRCLAELKALLAADPSWSVR